MAAGAVTEAAAAAGEVAADIGSYTCCVHRRADAELTCVPHTAVRTTGANRLLAIMRVNADTFSNIVSIQAHSRYERREQSFIGSSCLGINACIEGKDSNRGGKPPLAPIVSEAKGD
jgi:hypothetical protein